MSYSTNRRTARLSSSGRKQKQQKDSSRYPSITSIKIAEGANRYYVGKNENWIGVGEFILRKSLLLELLQASTDPNRSWLPSFPSACEQIKCWHAPKRFGAKKKSKHNLHGNCQKKEKHSSWYTTANRQRQHCWQRQVKQRKGKGKMMLGNDVGPKRWRKPVPIGSLLLCQKDISAISGYTMFSTGLGLPSDEVSGPLTSLWCCFLTWLCWPVAV